MLDDILEEFDDVFQVPTELLPNRLHDHAGSVCQETGTGWTRTVDGMAL